MNNYTNHSTTSKPTSLADLVASIKKIDLQREADDHKLIRFDGTMEEFEAELRKTGCHIRNWSGTPMIYSMQPSLSAFMFTGLIIQEYPAARMVLCGTPRVFERLKQGLTVRPVALIATGLEPSSEAI